MEIFIVYGTDPETSSGFYISGIFNDSHQAAMWVLSEENGQRILKTTFGPIEWDKMISDYRDY